MKKILYMIIFFLCLMITLILFNPPFISKSYQHTNDLREKLYMNKNDVLDETFVAKTNDLNSIGIFLYADNNQEEKCNLNIKLFDYKNNEIAQATLSKNSINSNYYNYLNFNKISNSMNKKFRITILNECDNSIALDFYDANEKNQVLFNEHVIEKNIFFVEQGCEKFYSYIGYIIVVIIIIIIPLIMIDDKGGKNV